MSSWDKSTIIITPTLGQMHISVTLSWLGLLLPVNNVHSRMAAIGLEVGEAYSNMVETILKDKRMKDFKYILTLEDDMIVPPGGLIKLHDDIRKGYDIVGGLYWTKDPIHSFPLVYGKPENGYEDTGPVDITGGIQEVNCLGMGFTLFRRSLFEDERFERPLFQTKQIVSLDGLHTETTTQDMFFMMQARKLGYKIAVDTDLRCGHVDTATGHVWGDDLNLAPYIAPVSKEKKDAVQE